MLWNHQNTNHWYDKNPARHRWLFNRMRTCSVRLCTRQMLVGAGYIPHSIDIGRHIWRWSTGNTSLTLLSCILNEYFHLPCPNTLCGDATFMTYSQIAAHLNDDHLWIGAYSTGSFCRDVIYLHRETFQGCVSCVPFLFDFYTQKRYNTDIESRGLFLKNRIGRKIIIRFSYSCIFSKPNLNQWNVYKSLVNMQCMARTCVRYASVHARSDLRILTIF